MVLINFLTVDDDNDEYQYVYSMLLMESHCNTSVLLDIHL